MPSARELALILKLRDEASTALRGFARRAASAARTMQSRMTGAFRRVSGGVSGLFRSLTSLKSLLVVGIAGIATRKAIQAFGDFEKGMNRVRALTGATGQSFTQLEDLAKELGRTTQFTARESADAMGFLAQAGFEADEVMQALPGTLQLAASAQLDLAQSADIVTNILTGLQLPVEQLGRANDVLVQTLTSTNVDLTQLGEAFKFVGPVAQSAGVDFEELSAAIGLLGNAGIQGSMAGTAMRGMIVRLLNPTKEAQAVIKRLGLEVTDTEGRMLPLNQIVEQLGASGADTADIIEIFGQRAGPGVAALVSQGADELRSLTTELENSGGTAQRIADIQMEGLAGAMTRMRSAIEGAAIAFGERLAPFATRMADIIQRLAGRFAEALEVLTEIDKGMGDVTESGFADFLEGLIPTVETLVVTWLELREVVNAVKIAFLEVVNFVLEMFPNLTRNFRVLGTFMIGLGKTIFQIFSNLRGAFGGLVAFMVRKMRDGVSAILEAIEPIADELRIPEAPAALRDAASALSGVALTIEANTGAVDASKKVQEEWNRTLQTSRSELAAQDGALASVASALGEARERQDQLAASTENARQRFVAARAAMAEAPQAGPPQIEGFVGPAAPEGAGQAFSLMLTPEQMAEGRQRAQQLADEVRQIEENLAQTRQLSATEQLAELDQQHAEQLARLRQFGASQQQIERANLLASRRTNQLRAQNFQATMSFISNSALRENREMFEIFKAIDIAQAIADTYTAANKALASAPPPVNYALAAAVVAAGIANVDRIRNTQFGSTSAGAVSIPTGGGGGGFGIGAAAPAEPALTTPEAVAAQAPAAPRVSVTVNGVVGNEEEVARRVAELVNQAVDQGAEVNVT